MPYKDQPRCKICQSILRGEIDKMLFANEKYTKIVNYCKSNGLDIDKHNLSRHKLKHTKISEDEIEARLIEDRQRAERQAAAKDGEKAAVGKYVAAATVLDRIVNDVFELLENNEIKPTLDHALKAIELRAKLKEGSGLESTLIEFMMGFSHVSAATQVEGGLKIVKTVNRPEGIMSELEDLTGASIRTGIDAIERADSDESRGGRRRRKIEEEPVTVDDELPEPKQIVTQGDLFGVEAEGVEVRA